MDQIHDRTKGNELSISSSNEVAKTGKETTQTAVLSPPPLQLKAENRKKEKVEPETEETTNQLQTVGAEEPSQPEGNDEKPNNTGLPSQLKCGIENLAGFSLDDVNVHYNSDKPAQLQAHAYAQGTDIHLASGQEKHLPHEAWHVVQQKQGRVQPTTQLKAFNINDDAQLEKEADVMGAKAMQLSIANKNAFSISNNDTTQNSRSEKVKQPKSSNTSSSSGQDIFQLKLEKGKLNIVGEHHSTSDKIRDLEKEFTAHEEFGGYWTEGDFKPDDENDEKFGDEPNLRALQGSLAFDSAIGTVIASYDAGVEVESIRKLGGRLRQIYLNIKNMKSQDEFSFDIEKLDAIATRLKDESEDKRASLQQLQMIRNLVMQKVVPILHPTLRTKSGTAIIRSLYMLINAESSIKEGIWKVGDAHIPDIEILIEPEKNVTYTNEKEFHDNLLDYLISTLD